MSILGETARIFISYRRKESMHLAGRLYDRLVAEFGIDQVFMDTNLNPGDEWGEKLMRSASGASLVIAVIGPEWFDIWRQRASISTDVQSPGRKPDAGVDDWVQLELNAARRAGVPVLPALAGDAVWPPDAQFPAEIKWLMSAQQARLRSGKDFEHDIEALVAAIHHAGRQAGALRRIADAFKYRYRHLLKASLWAALVVFSLVQILRSYQLLDGFDAFQDSFIQASHAQRADRFDPGYDVRIIAIDAFEYAEYFSEQSPLDYAQIILMLRALRNASERGGGCGSRLPIGIDLDLSPGNRTDMRDYEPLKAALRDLAGCRPVVLACPESMISGEGFSRRDREWLDALADMSRNGIYLATTTIDSWMLRLDKARASLGSVMARLAAGREPAEISARPHCVCRPLGANPPVPDSCADIAQALEDRTRHDAQTLILPQRGRPTTSLTQALSWTLSHPQVFSRSILLIGGSYGTTATLSLRAAGSQTYSRTTVHGWIAQGGPGSAQREIAWHVELLAAVLAGTVAAMLSLVLWLYIAGERRFSFRLIGYLAILMLGFGGPVLGLALGANYVDHARLLGSLGVIVFGVSIRTAAAGYEVLLERGAASFHGVSGLFSEAFKRTSAGVTARTRILVAMLEGAIIAYGLLLTWRSA